MACTAAMIVSSFLCSDEGSSFQQHLESFRSAQHESQGNEEEPAMISSPSALSTSTYGDSRDNIRYRSTSLADNTIGMEDDRSSLMIFDDDNSIIDNAEESCSVGSTLSMLTVPAERTETGKQEEQNNMIGTGVLCVEEVFCESKIDKRRFMISTTTPSLPLDIRHRMASVSYLADEPLRFCSDAEPCLVCKE